MLWQTVMGTEHRLQQGSQVGLLAASFSGDHVGQPFTACLNLGGLQHVLLDQAWWCHAGWGDATTACAHARSVDPGLPPPDTVVSCLSYSNGSAATVSITFASTNSRFSLSVVGTEGSLEVRSCCGVTQTSHRLLHHHVKALRVQLWCDLFHLVVPMQISRGGWGAPRVGYTLSFKTKQHSEAHFKQFLFTGLADELSAFAEQVWAGTGLHLSGHVLS